MRTSNLALVIHGDSGLGNRLAASSHKDFSLSGLDDLPDNVWRIKNVLGYSQRPVDGRTRGRLVRISLEIDSEKGHQKWRTANIQRRSCAD